MEALHLSAFDYHSMTTIPAVLKKVCGEGIRCMLVIPKSTKAQWWPAFEGIRVQSCAITNPDDESTKAGSPLRWRTIFAVIDGRFGHIQSAELRVGAPRWGDGGGK